jgi:hypothetical protein
MQDLTFNPIEKNPLQRLGHRFLQSALDLLVRLGSRKARFNGIMVTTLTNNSTHTLRHTHESQQVLSLPAPHIERKSPC